MPFAISRKRKGTQNLAQLPEVQEKMRAVEPLVFEEQSSPESQVPLLSAPVQDFRRSSAQRLLNALGLGRGEHFLDTLELSLNAARVSCCS